MFVLLKPGGHLFVSQHEFGASVLDLFFKINDAGLEANVFVHYLVEFHLQGEYFQVEALFIVEYVFGKDFGVVQCAKRFLQLGKRTESPLFTCSFEQFLLRLGEQAAVSALYLAEELEIIHSEYNYRQNCMAHHKQNAERTKIERLELAQ